tara:strand:- start:609 stop:755 length:147 start_codon:yes stop_codon:yes gene_type:complete
VSDKEWQNSKDILTPIPGSRSSDLAAVNKAFFRECEVDGKIEFLKRVN